MHTKTELHTHLMGMLSAKGFIKFLDKFDYRFPVDYDGKLNFDTTYVSRVPAIKMINDTSFVEQLSIIKGNKVNYASLDTLYLTRSTLIADLIEYLKKYDLTRDNYDELKYEIYGEYLNESLKELVRQDVEYVEISFSNAKIKKQKMIIALIYSLIFLFQIIIK